MLTLIWVKFPSSFACFSASSGYEGMSSWADTFQIACVIFHVVFLLFLLCFKAAVQPCLCHEISEFFCHFLLLLKQSFIHLMICPMFLFVSHSCPLFAGQSLFLVLFFWKDFYQGPKKSIFTSNLLSWGFNFWASKVISIVLVHAVMRDLRN